MKRISILFIVGAVLVSILDSFHTHGGVAYYTHPHFFKISIWSPFILGGATVVIGVTHYKFHPFIKHLKPALFVSLICFVAAYWVTAFVKVSNAQISLTILALYLIAWGSFDRTWQSLVLALATAIAGSIAEGLLGINQFFIYLRPDLFHVPVWLPLLYATASEAGGNLGRLILAEKC